MFDTRHEHRKTRVMIQKNEGKVTNIQFSALSVLLFLIQFGNWSWRIPSSTSFDHLESEAMKLRDLLSTYGRL